MDNIMSFILRHLLSNKYVLSALNWVIPIAIYFEAGIVSAVFAFFTFFLLIALTMELKRKSDKRRASSMIDEVLGEALKDTLQKVKERGNNKTTSFDTDDFSGTMTEVSFDDLPDQIKAMIKAREEEEEKEDTENVTKH